jgi:Fe-S cluster assembly protein SufD
VTTAIAQIESYLDSFTELEKEASAYSPSWLRTLRADAFARFCEVGFPTTHDEDWRFTNLSALVRTPFQMPGRNSVRPSASDIQASRMHNAAAQLVFVNGRFAPEFSAYDSLPDGVTISGLKQQIAENPAAVEAHLGRYLDTRRDPFSALNTAFLEDGAYIHVRRGIALEAPIHLLFLSTAENVPAMTHPRNLIVVERESQVTVVEDYASSSVDTPIFSNAVTELVVDENSTVSHYLIEREHQQAFNISTLRMQLGRSANVASHSLLLGGGLVRNNVHPVLAGEGGECLINGLFVGNNGQHLDNYMHVEHASPHCNSRQFYNGILDGRAHGVFHGRIVVHKDAQKTDAKQTNRNLLLADDAQIDTKPQLEIYADDVKCTHGATIGQIEENALFYLRSRGIEESSARRLLLMAFAGECLERMYPGPAREYAEALIQQYLSLMASSPALARTGNTAKQGRNWEEVG